MRIKGYLATGTLAIVALFGASAASAQDMATAYVVHGINGEDFGLDRALAVDVYVSGLGCAIPGFEFGNRVGPISAPEGMYDITISLADEVSPCEGTKVIMLEGVKLTAGTNVTLIAHRTADGSTGAGDQLELGVTASAFANDFTSTGPGKARVVVQHTAKAPSVDVVVSRDYSNPNAPGVTVPDFTNPTADVDAAISQINAELKPGQWQVALEVDGATVFGPDTLNLKPYTATYIYAVGEFPGTFQYLIFTENGLRDQPNADAERPRRALRGFGRNFR
jgi:hypothetical protein